MPGRRQWTHSRHCGAKSVTTWSPGATESTPSPTRSTTPRPRGRAPSARSPTGPPRRRCRGRCGRRRRRRADEHLARVRLRELDLLHLERRAELLQHRGADLHLGARSGASKPRTRCVLSQNGFVAEKPQRQSATVSPAGSSYANPVRVDQPKRARDPVGAVLAHRDRDRGHEFDSTLGLVRICLVTPFAWSLPHDVNQHVAGIAKELRALGHTVTVLAPSGRPADLAAGRRALARGDGAETIAIGTAVVSRRSSLGVPVGVRANLRLALQQGRFDVVHGFEPGLPSISYLALRDSEALGVASFFSPDRPRLPAPAGAPGEAARPDRRARSPPRRRPRRQPPSASPATTGRLPGVDTEPLPAGAKRKLVAIELHSGSLPVARLPCAVLKEPPGWEAVLLRGRSRCRRAPGSRTRFAALSAFGPAGPRPAPRCSPRPRSSCRPDRLGPPPPRGLGARAPRSPTRRACSTSRSWPQPPCTGWPRTARCASAKGRRPGPPPSRRASPPSRASWRPDLRRQRPRRRDDDPLVRAPLDPRRPAHAHLLVARLLDRGRRTARPRPGRGPRGDRRHRPQRLRRRPRGCREGTRACARRRSR